MWYVNIVHTRPYIYCTYLASTPSVHFNFNFLCHSLPSSSISFHFISHDSIVSINESIASSSSSSRHFEIYWRKGWMKHNAPPIWNVISCTIYSFNWQLMQIVRAYEFVYIRLLYWHATIDSVLQRHWIFLFILNFFFLHLSAILLRDKFYIFEIAATVARLSVNRTCVYKNKNVYIG